MQGDRKERIGELIRQEMSEIILRELKDPRIGFITITNIKMSTDLQHARVFVSVLGNEDQKNESLSGLQHAGGFLRKEIGRRLRLRHSPALSFHLDDSLEKSARIEKILKDMDDDGQ